MSENEGDSSRSIVDAKFRVKFQELPAVLHDWLGPEFEWESADVMDFGCGEGDMALGVAHHLGCKRIVGVDVGPHVHLCARRAAAQLGMQVLPSSLSLYRVEPGRLHDPDDRFDLIYSWSVLEHVDQRLVGDTIKMLGNALKPGGYLFVQISPLYYSAEGSHLFRHIPEPWAHLLDQQSIYQQKLKKRCKTQERFKELWATFRTLNKITAGQLESAIAATGINIVRRHTTEHAAEPSPLLLSIYREEILRTEQIVLLGRREGEIPKRSTLDTAV